MKLLSACLLGLCLLLSPSLVAQTPYRIPVTNDDGVRAPGILALAKALQPLGEVTIVAPAENQSGKGQAGLQTRLYRLFADAGETTG